MHVAALNPQGVTVDDIPAAVIVKEKAIVTAQAQQSGKPAHIAEKMIAGRLKKFLAEQSLEGQAFVRDSDKTVAEMLKAHHAKVITFIRFELGEGIEREKSNFAEEVKAASGT